MNHTKHLVALFLMTSRGGFLSSRGPVEANPLHPPLGSPSTLWASTQPFSLKTVDLQDSLGRQLTGIRNLGHTDLHSVGTNHQILRIASTGP